MVEVCVLASVKNPHLSRGNLGDIFGYVLIEFLCKDKNITVKRLGVHDSIRKNTIAVVGSICELCNTKAKNNKITILGSNHWVFTFFKKLNIYLL